MPLEAARGKLVIERETAPERTPGGIILPDVAKQATMRGSIVDVGEPNRNADGSTPDVDYERGQVVIFSHYAGHEIEHRGKKFLVIDMNEVLAIDPPNFGK